MQTTTHSQDQPTIRGRSGQLMALYAELDRAVRHLRMRTKAASAEAQHLLDAINEEVKRFGVEAAYAANEFRPDLRDVAMDLRLRLRKLANQVSLPRPSIDIHRTEDGVERVTHVH